MEIQELKDVVIIFVLIGVLLGIGILVFDSFGTVVKTSNTGLEGSVNVSTNTLTGTQCVAFTSIVNMSGAPSYDLSTYNVTLSSKYTSCAFTHNLPLTQKYNITYTYLTNTSSSNAAGSVTSSLGGLASNWLGLIVTVVALSIVLVLVIRSLGGTNRR